jgi:hypothetical protein
VLLAAADRIRDLAAETTPGQWSHEYGVVQEDESVTYAVEAAGEHWVGELRTAGDATWVAALSPAVAPTLELILRDAASDYEVRSRIFTPESMEQASASRRFAGPLALARLLVGENET